MSDRHTTDRPADRESSWARDTPATGAWKRTDDTARTATPASARGVELTLARHPKPLGGDPVRNYRPTFSLTEMILDNTEDAPHTLSMKRKPPWLRAKVPGGEAYKALKRNVDSNALHTVCEEAACPNMGECWSRGVATIMILGDTCTRACGFCNVKSGRPPVLDRDEPRRVAESLRHMGLKHVVITSVDRDELSDGGAGIWAETIMRAREACPGMSIEVLIPDFMGKESSLQMVIDAQPHIIAHNLETVKRTHPAVRPSARWERSLEVLRRVKAQGVVAKTGFMVGIGESDAEMLEAMDEIVEVTSRHDGPRDPRFKGEPDPPGDPCDIVTIGQYLQPTRNHLPIDRWVHPDTFAWYEREGLRRGLKVVQSGPLVRSSYLADAAADRLTNVMNERENGRAPSPQDAADAAKLRRVNELIGRG